MVTESESDTTPNFNGILIPDDPEWKEAIEKTANYVKRNGREFEQKLDVTQFPFLQEKDQHNGYYQHLLKREGAQYPILTDHVEPKIKKDVLTIPEPFVFATVDRNVPKKDLEIVKITALFCVQNEKTDYLNTLRLKCADNPLLAFLKPQHPLNETFTNFINQYKQVARQDFGLRASLEGEGKLTILRRCFERAKYCEYSQSVEVEQVRAQERLKAKFFAYAWDIFEKVGTINIEEGQECAEPLQFDLLRQKTLQKNAQDKTFTEFVVLSSLNLKTGTREEEQKPKKKGKMRVRAAGETRLKQKSLRSERQVECPITHRMIAESNFDKHIQVLLSDPNYTKERQEYEAKNNISNLTLESVHQNIKRLSKNESSQVQKKQRT
ncbi:LANO_0G03268g1_1 [Lachancea nothofagi CBS 11611]|uniref:LANO_0G03268g1_1 n=1 Tax=Lachancea nothofagi CBS 11611 TaxID=1266666 RepID=A0A1G4KFV7_9SACH|nr:LANO_0G03268g1_1 [Lachancea nothofagi CBS 11611]